MAEPSDEDIRLKMEELVPKVNLETMTTKQFMSLLSKKMGGYKLSHKKKFIKQAITEILDAMDDEENEEQDTGSDEDESEEEIEVPKKKGGGLSVEKELSPELSALLGSGKMLPRTEVVKGLWVYIKKHELQNPDDRREILLDKRLYALFGVKQFTMFSMNKYIGAHIHPFTPVDLTKLSENSKKRKAAKKEQKKKGVVKKPRKSGTQTPYRLSDELALVVGKSILPRPQVTQGLWKYIKEHNLQVSLHKTLTS
jgi:upstream activation factor subunit UAF30